jgi:heme-degrading monooxygenase HmoA
VLLPDPQIDNRVRPSFKVEGSGVSTIGRNTLRISKDADVVTLINVFETTPEKQQALIDQWVRFTEAVRNEPGYIGTALHKSTDGTRVINYAHWRSQADFDAFLNRHRSDFAQFFQNASRVPSRAW